MLFRIGQDGRSGSLQKDATPHIMDLPLPRKAITTSHICPFASMTRRRERTDLDLRFPTVFPPGACFQSSTRRVRVCHERLFVYILNATVQTGGHSPRCRILPKASKGSTGPVIDPFVAARKARIDPFEPCCILVLARIVDSKKRAIPGDLA